MLSSNGNILRVTGHFCAGNNPPPPPPPPPPQRPVTRSFDVFFDLCLNKCLSKQSWRQWFETPSRLLWRHSNANASAYHLNPSRPSHHIVAKPLSEPIAHFMMGNIGKLSVNVMSWRISRLTFQCKHVQFEWLRLLHPTNFQPTSTGKHSSIGYLLPCATDFKTNHAPVYLQWIGIFDMSTEPHHVISMAPRQTEVPGFHFNPIHPFPRIVCVTIHCIHDVFVHINW